MGFLAPLALSLAALSLPILIFYMLKLRREETVVSSTMLWQQVLRDQEANAPWQRLRRNLLLLFQLLLLFLLVMALARPYSEISRVVQGNVIVLLDASASMQATDVSPSRFEVARDHARRIVDGLGANDTMTLIAVGDTPHVLSSLTHDHSLLRRALTTARVSNTQADWEAAFILASSSARQALHNTVVILSDGGLPSELPELPGQVRYVPIGTTGENQAISALAIRDGPAGPQAFVRVSNRSTQPVTALIQIYTDGDLFDARTLSLAPESERGFSLDDLPFDVRQVEARLDNADALALDDVAWAVRSPGEQATILLTTLGNTFLERALGTLANTMPNLNPITAYVTRTLTNTQVVSPVSPPALYVYDGVLPAALPGSGNLFFIAPPESTDLFAVTGSLTQTHVSRVEYDDPLLRYVDLGDLHIARARAIETPAWARTLVQAQGGRPLLLAGEVNGRRIAILAFDLHHSDLPLQIAFPILLANLINWLAPTSSVDVPTLLSPGTPVTIRPQIGATAITVLSPSGRQWTYPVEGSEPIPFAQTHELGIYTIKYTIEHDGEQSRILRETGQVERPRGREREPGSIPTGTTGTREETQFAVNLFSELESHIEPQDAIAVGTSSIDGQATHTIARREWWRWLVLASLLISLVEWAVHQRRSAWTSMDQRRWTEAQS